MQQDPQEHPKLVELTWPMPSSIIRIHVTNPLVPTNLAEGISFEQIKGIQRSSTGTQKDNKNLAISGPTIGNRLSQMCFALKMALVCLGEVQYPKHQLLFFEAGSLELALLACPPCTRRDLRTKA